MSIAAGRWVDKIEPGQSGTRSHLRMLRDESLLDCPASPLFLDGWLEFNRLMWDVTPQRVRFTAAGKELPAVDAVLYLDKNGQLCRPNLNLYLPVAMVPTDTSCPARLERQWLDVGTQLAEGMRGYGMAEMLPLPPEIQDVRPWQWAGFNAEVFYTYCLDLPRDRPYPKTIRNSINRSKRAGFTCIQERDLKPLFECLQSTEERQGFSHNITRHDLELARDLLGDETLRVYVCYAPNGEPASALAELHVPGTRAIGWLAGTKTDYLSEGVAQHLQAYSIADLADAGATGYDFVGASTVPAVARAKSQWGARLVPHYSIEGGRVRTVLRHARKLWQFRKLRSA